MLGNTYEDTSRGVRSESAPLFLGKAHQIKSQIQTPKCLYYTTTLLPLIVSNRLSLIFLQLGTGPGHVCYTVPYLLHHDFVPFLL